MDAHIIYAVITLPISDFVTCYENDNTCKQCIVDVKKTFTVKKNNNKKKSNHNFGINAKAYSVPA